MGEYPGVLGLSWGHDAEKSCRGCGEFVDLHAFNDDRLIGRAQKTVWILVRKRPEQAVIVARVENWGSVGAPWNDLSRGMIDLKVSFPHLPPVAEMLSHVVPPRRKGLRCATVGLEGADGTLEEGLQGWAI